MKQGTFVKRMLAALLCAVLVLSCVPGNLLTAYATETDSNSNLWQQYGEIDKTTGGKWQTAGYGDEMAVLFGWGAASTDPATAKEVSRGSQSHLYVIGGDTFYTGGNDYTNEFDNATGHAGNYKIVADPDGVANLQAPAGYTGEVPTFNTYVNTGTWGNLADVTGYSSAYTVGKYAAEALGAYEGSTGSMYYVVNSGGSTLAEDKEYVFTLYADGDYSTTDYSGTVRLSFLEYTAYNSTEVPEVYGTHILNASDFENSGYVSFVVKGAFRLVLDFACNPRLCFSAAFFDEYVEPEALPENVLPEALTEEDLWQQVGEIDKTTGGAWQSVGGYGDEQAILIGWSTFYYQSAFETGIADGTLTNSSRKGLTCKGVSYHTNNTSDYIWMPSIDSTANGTTSYPNAATRLALEVWQYPGSDVNGNVTGVPALEIPENYRVPDTTYTGTQTPVFNAYTVNGRQNTTDYNDAFLFDENPLSSDMTKRLIMTFTVPEAKQDNLYTFTIYTDTRNLSTDMEQDIELSFLNLDGTAAEGTTITKHRLNTKDFGKDGGYVSFLIKGSFLLCLDTPSAADRFGFSAFFFDEYVAPAAPITPEAPVTYENWTQVGEIDKTTGGKWQTKGYGDEQAIITGWSSYYYQDDFEAAIADGTAASSTRKGQTCKGAFYHVNNTDQDIWMPSNDGNANGTTVYPNAATRLAAEVWMYVGSDASGNVTGVPALEIPADYRTPNDQNGGVYTGSQTPVFNGYTVNGRVNNDTYNDTFLFDENPLSSDMTKRLIMTFTVPEAKQDNEYYFSIYADTRNLSTNMAQDFELSFMTLDGTAAEGATITKHRFNTADFGKDGAYVTFKVQGSFLLCYDAPDAADRFGFSGFFFNTQPIKEAPVEESWTQLGEIDKTTGGAWQSEGGYGEKLAVLFGWSESAVNDFTRGDNKHLYLVNGVAKAHNSASGAAVDTWLGYPGNMTKHDGLTYLERPANYTGAEVTYHTRLSPHTGSTATNTGFPNYATTVSIPAELTNATHRAFIKFRDLDTWIYGSNVGAEYVLTLYADSIGWDSEYTGKVCFSFTTTDGAELLSQTVVDASEFDKNGGYISFKVTGDFDLVIDQENNRNFGLSAVFIDEYVAPALDEVESASITLDGTIGVNYGVNLNLIAKEDTDAKMVISQDGKDDVIINVADAVSKNQLYWFSKGVAAKEMADVITAQMHYSDGSTGDANEYSVQKYANTVLNTTTVTAEMQALLVRMLNYGAFAQKYFGYNTANMANSALTNEAKWSGISTVSTEHLQKYLANCDNGSDAAPLGYASLLLKSDTTLRLSFRDTKAAGKTFKLVTSSGETELTLVDRSGNYSYVDIENIAAAELDDVFTVNIYDGDTLVSTVSYCPLAYVYSAMTQSDDENLINAVKSLYLYNQAANAYFA